MIIETIKKAGQARKLLYIEARESDGTVEPREVEPYSFRVKGGNSLFYGWDVKKNALRSFRVDRIIKVEVTDTDFEPRWDIEL